MSHVVRRVVTGHDVNGKSVVVSDGSPPRAFSYDAVPGLETIFVWSNDQPMAIPHRDGDPTITMDAFFPDPAGTRFLIVVHPPGSGVTSSDAGGSSHDEAGIGELHVAMDADDSGMHATDTVDYGVVVSGELWMELDDGIEVHLRPGDCIVQNGARHGWRNHGDVPCTVAFVMIGAERTQP
jgi:mannose-6-phosphate isomerase-like protein (cupin superfamily)